MKTLVLLARRRQSGPKILDCIIAPLGTSDDLIVNLISVVLFISTEKTWASSDKIRWDYHSERRPAYRDSPGEKIKNLNLLAFLTQMVNVHRVKLPSRNPKFGNDALTHHDAFGSLTGGFIERN